MVPGLCPECDIARDGRDALDNPLAKPCDTEYAVPIRVSPPDIDRQHRDLRTAMLAPPTDARSLADRLIGLDTRLPQGDVTIRRLMLEMGNGAYGLVLLVLALPVLIPVPAVPTGVVCGTIIAAFAVRMAFGSIHPPRWVLRRRLPRGWITRAVSVAHPHLDRIERRLRTRLPFLTSAASTRWLASVILLAAILIILPIPLGNALPALGVIGIALGLAVRDGLAVLAGIASVLLGAVWLAVLVGFGQAVARPLLGLLG